MRARTTARLHLSSLEPLQLFTDAVSGSCLDPAMMSEGTPLELTGQVERLFIRGGSQPRDVWITGGLGAVLDGTLVDSGQPHEIVDMCTILTVLGSNDPWVKMKQLAYVLSDRPHHVTIRLGCDLYYRVARRILAHFATFGGAGAHVLNMRQCNGSDAVELALHSAWNAARGEPNRRKLGTFRGSYHGENLTAALISDRLPEHGSGRLLVDEVDNVVQFASPADDENGNLDEDSLWALAELEESGRDFFAVIVEPIQWRNAVHAVPFEFLRRLRDICTRHSICLIFDEIHNGFGYTGTIAFAECCGVMPDISAMSKGLTSGHGSLAITVATREFAQVDGTFAGKSNAADMLGLVAVDAVLDRLLGLDDDEIAGLPAWIPENLAEELHSGLLKTTYSNAVGMLDGMMLRLRSMFPTLVGDSTGIGLVRGLVMLDESGRPSPDLAAEVAKRGLRHGVYVRQADSALFIKPCITINADEIERACNGLAQVFTELLNSRASLAV